MYKWRNRQKKVSREQYLGSRKLGCVAGKDNVRVGRAGKRPIAGCGIGCPVELPLAAVVRVFSVSIASRADSIFFFLSFFLEQSFLFDSRVEEAEG